MSIQHSSVFLHGLSPYFALDFALFHRKHESRCGDVVTGTGRPIAPAQLQNAGFSEYKGLVLLKWPSVQLVKRLIKVLK